MNQIARLRAQQNYLFEPTPIQRIPHACHRAQQVMSVGYAHGNPWNYPPAPAGSNDYVPHHQKA